MQIWLNDVPMDLPSTMTLEQALETFSYGHSTFAVAINHIFIPKQEHPNTMINPGDRIDIVVPMQGG